VADVLGVPYYVWDLAEQVKAEVVDEFIAEYAAGRTPNPCMRCNERIMFAALLEKALALGFDAVATGHYASITTDADVDAFLAALPAAHAQAARAGLAARAPAPFRE
jgi:tRNA-specific 2-thiouridylase